MQRVKRIVIVGGGIAGVSAAYGAVLRARELGASVSVTLLERSARFGGNLLTERHEGFLLDRGPDSWVATKPAATALVRELGLTRAIVGTNPKTRRFSIVWRGRLHLVPEGVVLGVPTQIGPLARTGLFSPQGKLRMAWEPFVAPRFFEGDDDESLAGFATRRLGHEAAERLVAPLLGGISGSDASDVSVRAGFPQLVTMEQEYGSLVRGMIAMRSKRTHEGPTDIPRSVFLSLTGGVEDLVRAIVDRLRHAGVELRSGAPVQSIEREPDAEQSRWRVRVPDGPPLHGDEVLLAIPAHAAAPIVAALDRRAAAALEGIPFGSTATVFLAYRRQDVSHPLDAVGFIVPRAAGRPIAASTWVSSKWDGRAPEGHVLVRVFVSGAAGPEVLGQDDDALVRLSRAELRSLMGLDAEPLWAKVYRLDRATAVMRVGHAARMRAVRESLAQSAPGVLLAGGGYDGVGISDCVQQGREAGRGMVESALSGGR
ncbi:MAG: protoporphyrinogen oxidase [Polyangiaceae bacterium]|jgi:oxygen-dependent protoporphyrinogen oxidase